MTTALDVVNPDDGVTSLREAILFANSSAGFDTITFNIPGSGVQTISVGNTELGALPNALDFIKDQADRKVLELHYTQKTAARPFIAPPGVAAERMAILRGAFIALAKDPEFLAEAERTKIEVAPISGEEVDKIVRLISATPPAIAERFSKAFAPEAK